MDTLFDQRQAETSLGDAQSTASTHASPVEVTPLGSARRVTRKTEARTRETISRRLLGAADATAVSVALVTSAIVVGRDELQLAAVSIPLLFVLSAKAMGLYDRDAELLHKTTLDEVPKLLGLATAFALVLWLLDGAVIVGEIGRPQVIASWLILFLAMIVLRTAARAMALRVSAVERCLFVGDAESAEEFREKLATSAVRAELVGWIPSEADPDEAPELALPEKIRSLVVERDIHRIVLGPGADDDELLDGVRRIEQNGVRVSVMPKVARLVNTSVVFDRLNGITLLGVRRFEMTMSSQIIKRTFDITGSLAALLLLSPVMLLVALLVRIDSRGPALFRQPRAGRHGEPFDVIKFRSMHEGAEALRAELLHLNEADGVFKMNDDPRVTRVGRIIRRTHIDELPQLLNVLKGEMSLVGPRPLPLDEDRRIEGWHRRRLDLRPGMTGPWQVLGSSRIPVREMVKLDYRYVADWSLWNDVRILLLTLGHVARRRGL